MLTPRVLALDVGRRRIGLALSDPLGITAQGLETMTRTNVREDLRRLAGIVREREVALLLLGLPLHLSGDEGTQAKYVRDFGARLEAECGVPVEFWDERMTTVEAQRVLRQSGISLEKRGQAVDRLSAVILLNSYLDRQPGPEPEAANP